MAYEIIWSPKAILTFDAVIYYLQTKWTQREVRSFVVKTEKVLRLISKSPYLFRSSESQNIHEVLVTKHNLLLYQINGARRQVELLVFFDTRQHPKKKKKYL